MKDDRELMNPPAFIKFAIYYAEGTRFDFMK